MVILHYGQSIYTAEKAAKTDTEVILYNENNREVLHFVNVIGDEWNYISLEGGEWLLPSDVPTEMDKVRADIDYLMMISGE